MTLLPVLTRELLVSARRKSTYLARFIASALTIGMGIWLLLFSNAAMGPAEQGKFILSLFTWFSFVYCLFAGADSTSDCISMEKREGTLGLLFLTDLRPLDLLIGKIACTSLHHLYTLLAVVPMLALCLIMGGVTGGEVLSIAGLLLNTLFFSICAGALVSTFSVDQRKAMFGSAVLILGAVSLPFILEGFYVGGLDKIKPDDPIIHPLSPLYPFLSVVHPGAFKNYHAVIASTAFVHFLGWMFLLLAARSLPARVHESTKAEMSTWETIKRRVLYGTAEQRIAYRAKLLDQNAYFWLTAKERLKAAYSWLLFATYFILYLLVWIFANDMATDSGFPLMLGITMHALYKCWIASEVSARIVEDRRVGAFELLLSTTITPGEISTGLNRALFRQFSKPIAATLLLDCLLLFAIYTHAREPDIKKYAFVSFVAVQVIFLVDIYSLKWLAAWNSLFSNKQGVVLSRVAAQVLFLPWILTIMTGLILMFAEKLFAPRTGYVSYESLLIIWILFSVLFSLVPGWHARSCFLNGLRTVAANRFDLSAKRGLLASIYSKFRKHETATDQPFWVRHWVASSVAVALLLLIIAFSFRHHSWKNKVQERITVLKKNGIPVNSKDLNAWMPYVPQEENGGIYLDQASMLSPAPAFARGLNYRNGIFSEPMPLDKPLPELILTNAQRIEKMNMAALQAATALTNYSRASFEIRWNHPWSPYDRRTVNIRNMVVALECHALLEIERGNFQSAGDRLIQLLMIYKFSSEFPSFQVVHIRREIIIKAANLFERLVSKGWDVRSAQATKVQSLLVDVESIPTVKHTLIAVRAFSIETCTSTPVSMIRTLFPMQNRGLEGFVISGMLALEHKTGTLDKKLVAYLDRMDRGIAMADLNNFDQQISAARKIDADSRDDLEGNMFQSPTSFFSPYMSWMVTEQFFVTAKCRLMQCLIQVERYRLAHGKTPGHLEDQAIFPKDPFTGKPFKIITNDKGFIIYSVGSDMVDHGGMEARRNSQQSTSDIPILRVYQDPSLGK